MNASDMVDTCAIILAAYGALHPDVRSSVEDIRARVRALYPDCECLVAYTSTALREKMIQAGHEAPSVPQAVDEMRAAGHGKIVVQSLHIVPGEEFHAITSHVQSIRMNDPDAPSMEVGFPLAYGEHVFQKAAKLIIEILPRREDRTQAAVLMGHGTAHLGHVAFTTLAKTVRGMDPSVHLGVMEGEPGLETIIPRLKQDGVKKVHLHPFLFGAGIHATRDMTGPSPSSWASILEDNGFETVAAIRGVCQYDALISIWLDHLAEAMERLPHPKK